jgi:aryl-alcohol dehydrogenase-like predicted oxidoreductase
VYRLFLAWMIARCPAAIPIAGARRVESIEDSAAAGSLVIPPADVRVIEAALKA